MSRLGPRAALHVDWRGSTKPGPQDAVYFFRDRQYIRWDVEREVLGEGYPRAIREGWPGLIEARPGEILHGAMHVPDWDNRVFFFFTGSPEVLTWDVERHAMAAPRVPVADLMPSALTADGWFTPLYADTGDARRVYAFRGDTYTRFTVSPGATPDAEDDGYPRKIGDGWTGGISVAPTCAVCVHWHSRSEPAERRKIYFFLGDLYARWDVASHSENYRLDIPSGWKGWPEFD